MTAKVKEKEIAYNVKREMKLSKEMKYTIRGIPYTKKESPYSKKESPYRSF